MTLSYYLIDQARTCASPPNSGNFGEEAVTGLALDQLADSTSADIVAHSAIVGEAWRLQIFQGSGRSAEKLGYSFFES